MLPRLQDARRRLSFGVGPVFALLPHPLHHEVAQLAAGAAAVPHVPPGVEVQGVTADWEADVATDACGYRAAHSGLAALRLGCVC